MSLEIRRSGGWIRERLKSVSFFDKKSLRTVTRGSHKLIVGCRKGLYKNRRCIVGTQVQAVLHPRKEYNKFCKEGRCPARL